MPEIIKITGSNDIVDMFIIEAMVEKTDNIDTYIKGQRGPVDVEVTLLVNGIEAPFTSVAKGFMRRMQSHVEQEVLKKAKELISTSGLNPVLDALQAAEWKIEQALEQALENNRGAE